MALIKCNECGKEISDKAKVCPHCGFENNLIICPECKKEIKNNVNTCPNCGYEIKKENKQLKSKFNTGIKIWLILCVVACFGYYFLVNYLKIITLPLMTYLVILLGVSYIVLLVNKSKINLYIILGINAVILVYNLFSIGMVISLLNIICVLINAIITFLVVRKHLNNNKLNLFGIISYSAIIVILVIIFVANLNNSISNKVVGSWIGDNNFEFDFYKDNKCRVKVPDIKVDPTMDDQVNILYSNCNYTLEDNKLTLTFDYAINYLGVSVPMNEEFVLYYNKSTDSFSNDNGKVSYHRK